MPKAQETKTQTNKWDYIKLKGSYTAKETISKMKRQPIEWEKLFAKDKSDLSSHTSQHRNKQTWNWDMSRRHESHFSKKTHRWPEDTWKDAQHHQSSGNCSPKPQWDNASCLSEWPPSKAPGVARCGEKGTLVHCWRESSWYSQCGNQHGDSLEK